MAFADNDKGTSIPPEERDLMIVMEEEDAPDMALIAADLRKR